MVHEIRAALKRVVRKGTLLHRAAESLQRCLWKHAPRFFAWKTSTRLLDIDVTTRCNLRCFNCNRSIGLAPADEHISLDQLKKFLRESLEARWRWRTIRLVGGEPTLHPQFQEILELVSSFRTDHPECDVVVVTNGYGEAVQSVLGGLPDWVRVSNSRKTSNTSTFQTYNEAPVDVEGLRKDDFSRGCFITEYCGMSLTRSGFYCCAPGAAVDRVFGFDIGAKSLAAFTPEVIKEQRSRLCRYCGHYKYNYAEESVTEGRVSPVWREALESYEKKRPALTPY